MPMRIAATPKVTTNSTKVKPRESAAENRPIKTHVASSHGFDPSG